MNHQDILDGCIYFDNCEKLVLEYWDMMPAIIRKAFRVRHARYSAQDIEDLRNEVFVRLFENAKKKLKQYDDSYGLSLKGWVILIANQTVGMYLRKKDRNGYLGKGSFDELTEEIGISENEKRYEARDMLIRIENAMTRLSSSEQLAIRLLFEDSLSLQDAAKVMNRTPNNLSQIRFRAVEKLKKIIGKM